MSAEVAKYQMEIVKMRVMYRHARIVSGAYKVDSLSAVNMRPELVEEMNIKRLTNELEVMKRHIEFMEDCLDHISFSNEKE